MRIKIAGIRGLFGFFFSKGIDRLLEKISNTTIANAFMSDTRMFSHASDAKIDKFNPDILVGHSLGANEAIKQAQDLMKEGRTVKLLVLFDPAFFGFRNWRKGTPKGVRYAPEEYTIPSNVEHVINFVSGDFRARFVKTAVHNKGTVVQNFNLLGLRHINMLKHEPTMAFALSEILRAIKEN